MRFVAPGLYLREIILSDAFSKNKINHTSEAFSYLCELLLQIPSRVRYGNSDFGLKDNLWSSVAESLIADNSQLYKKEIDFCIKK